MLPHNNSILILDDEPDIVNTLKKILIRDYRVNGFTEIHKAKEFLKEEKVDLVLLDYKLKDGNGLEVLLDFKKSYPEMEVVIITAYGEIEKAVSAVKAGAFHFLTKPLEITILRNLCRNVFEKRISAERAKVFKNQVERKYNIDSLIGHSEKMEKLRKFIVKAQAVDSNVIIIGESGTGKELISRIIHAGSNRADRPFLPINCGAISKELIESELFGHVKGSFTGAVADKPGLFEAVGGGTMLLDEITEMPIEAQIKLNRALQEKEFIPVGSTKPKRINARIVSATNKTKSELSDKSILREDLYYRLNVFPIEVPPLRDRKEEIEELSNYFMERISKTLNKNIIRFTAQTLEIFKSYRWPGNVRQLENTVERMAILEESDEITTAYMPPEMLEGSIQSVKLKPDLKATYKKYIESIKSKASNEYLQALLKETGGNITEAAKIAGMERESFHRLLKKNRKRQ